MNRSRITGDLVSQNNIFVDIANDRVGIGSTIPTAKLDIRGRAQIGGTNDIVGTPYSYFYGRGNGGDGVSVYAAEPSLELVGTNGGSHAASLLFRTAGNDGIGFNYNPGGNTLELKSFDATGNNFQIHASGNNVSNLKNILKAISGGAVELYHNNVKKIETTAYGVNVTGTTDTDGLVVSGVTTSTVGASGVGSVVKINKSGTSELTSIYNNNAATLAINDSGAGAQIVLRGQSPKLIFDQTAGGNGSIYYDSTDFVIYRGVPVGSPSAEEVVRFNSFGLNVTGTTDTDGLVVSGITTTSTMQSTGSFTITSSSPTINLTESDANPDYQIKVSAGEFKIKADGTGKILIRSDGHIDLTDHVDISSGLDVTGDLTLTDTTADANAGPEFKLFRNSASPADADYLGQIKFAGESDTGVERNYAKITGKILDASNGTEDGILEFAHIKAGSQTITGRWRSDSLQLLNGTALTVAGSTTVTGNIIPSSDSATDIGTNSVRFANIYADTLYGDGSNLTGIAADKIFEGNTEVETIDTGSNGIIKFTTEGSERLRILSDGKVLIGHTSNIFSYKLAVFGTDGGNSGISASRFSNNTSPASLLLSKSRSATIGNYAVLQNNDEVGMIDFRGADGSDNMSKVAEIKASVDGTPGSNDMPGRLTFHTTADGASTTTERLRIHSNGNISIQTNDVGFSGAGTLRINSGSTAGVLNLDGGATNHGGEINLFGGSNGGRILFRTGQGSGQQGEKMRLDENGRLLLGTTTEGFAEADDLTINSADHGGITIRTPTNKEGNIAFSDTTSGTGEYSGLIRYRHSNNDLGLWTNSLLRLLITSSGSVRVGDNSSFSAHTAADNLVVGDSSGSNGMTILTNESTGNIFFNDGSGNEGVVQYIHSSSPNYMRIASSGHIRFDAARMSISDDNIEPTAGDLASGASFGIPRLHMRGDNAQSGAYELMARFQSGNDSDNSGATIVLNHSNDRGLALQGGRGQSNRSFGAIKAIDNIGRLSSCFDYLGGNGQGVNRLSLYTGESTTTNERFRIDSGGGVIISNAGTFPSSTSETLHVQGEGHNGHGTSNTRSVLNVVAARTSNTSAMGIWVGARTNENTAVIGTRTSNGNLAIETYNSGWGERLRIRSDGKSLFYGTLGAGNLPLGGNPAPAAIQIRCNSKFNGIAFGENAVSGCIGMGGDDTSTAMVFTANAHPANLGGGVHDTFEWRSGTSGGGGPGKYMTLDTQGDLTLETGSLKVSNGEGVDFSSTGNGSGSMTNELLDDYEEGTWTPTAAQGASGITVYASRYTKVGNKVFIDFRGLLTGTNGSSVRIGGLPYPNMNSSAHNIGPIMHNGFDFAGSTEPVAVSYITGTNSYFQLYYSRTNSNGWIAVTGNDTNGQQFITSLTYFTS